MNHSIWKTGIIALLCAALMLSLTPVKAESTYDLGYVTFEVSYTDAQGVLQTVYPIPVGYEGYEGSYWANIPAEALLSGLTLHIVDESGQFASFMPADGTTLTGLMDAGSTLTETVPLDIQCLDKNGQILYLLHLYVSTVAAEPETPAETPVQEQKITVYYRSLDGGDVMDVASAQEVTLQPGANQPVYANPTDLLADYTLSGESVQYVTVDELGATPYEVTFYYTYSAPVVEPVKVPVHYYDSSYQSVADDGEELCGEGTRDIVANPVNLKANYKLIGESVQQVTVTADGAAPAEVIFFYQYVAPAVSPVSVPIRYYEEGTETPVADDGEQQCAEGTSEVRANPVNLQPDYELLGDAAQPVTVTADGANPAEVIFYYRHVEKITEAPTEAPTEEPTQEPQDTKAPAPKIALVNVSYVYEDTGKVFYSETATCVEGAENRIVADSARAESGYQVHGDGYQLVVVDAGGVASPASVTFYFYRQQTGEIAADVTVLYMTQDGKQVASPTPHRLTAVGENLIYAEPADLEEGYDLIDVAPQSVTLYDNGSLSSASVTFYYQKSVETEPNPGEEPSKPTDTPSYDLTATEGYGYPRADGVNFRSAPVVDDTNIIGSVNKSDLLELLGMATNSAGEKWYYVSVNGQEGFLRENFVRTLTEEEVNALKGYTQPPTQQPTAAPTAIPDGAVIDLWGEVSSKSVNFRSSQKASGNNKIATLSRGANVWIYGVETVDNTRWYSVRVNGKDGYIVADYLTVYSKEDSDRYQSTLPSPMPTQTAIPTQVPTSTPTQTPTQSPTPIGVPTATPTQVTASPAPYVGYALTSARTAVRRGIDRGDESIIETVEPSTLVLISAQTYVGSECWDSVSVLSSGNSGFMEDARLRRINNEEAKYYLDQIKQTATVAPAETPVPFTGYAKTLGSNVPLRTFMDTNAQIVTIMSANSVVNVFMQETVNGETWCQIQYGPYYGYVRRDMIQQMNDWEIQGYLESLKSPTPTPAATPTAAPITGNSLSSYGYVSRDRVNLRKDATKTSSSLRLMSQYAFALVMGTETNSEGTWYHILQNGTEGYVLSTYFKTLTINELSQFLTSDEYLSASGGSSSSGSTSSSGSSDKIQSVEDYNQGVWKNPALSASYEPFNPYQTPTANPADVVTATPSVSPSPTPTIEPIIVPTQAPNSTGGSFPTGLVVLLVVLILGGGGVYAYTLYRRNERRRAAMRAQQARRAQQAASQQPAMRPAAGNPAQQQQTRKYPMGGAPYAPSQNGAPRPANSQYQGGNPQATQRYNPQMMNDYARRATSEPTTAYRPVSEDTGAYRRPPVNGQTTNPYNPQTTLDAQRRSGETRTYQPRQSAPQAPIQTNNPVGAPDRTAAFGRTPNAEDASAQGRKRRMERFHHDDEE